MSDKSLLLQLIEGLQCLPGVGRKSAQRMAYHLLEHDRGGAMKMAKLIEHAMEDIGNCELCRNYTAQAQCDICANPRREHGQLCIVESPADVAALEASACFHGLYFVLMGHLSPLDGIGPDEIGLGKLGELIDQRQIDEVIIATSATVEGEATAHFIADMIKRKPDRAIRASRLAQGVPIGGELEYLDQSTLALSLANRRDL